MRYPAPSYDDHMRFEESWTNLRALGQKVENHLTEAVSDLELAAKGSATLQSLARAEAKRVGKISENYRKCLEAAYLIRSGEFSCEVDRGDPKIIAHTNLWVKTPITGVEYLNPEYNTHFDPK